MSPASGTRPPGEPPGMAVRADGLHRTFRGRDGAVIRAVDGVAIDVPAGAWIAVAGPSGCGKSTLLALLGTLERPDAGTVSLDGADVARTSDAERTRLRRRIGFVFQSAPMLARLPLWENVTQALVPQGAGRDARRAAAARELERVGLGPLLDRAPEELSGGERQRAAVARAMVKVPRLLVADEPTSQLDPESAASVLRALHDAHAAGVTVIVAAHDSELLRASPVIHRMAAGRLVT